MKPTGRIGDGEDGEEEDIASEFSHDAALLEGMRD
jgi:hypothetical protein